MASAIVEEVTEEIVEEVIEQAVEKTVDDTVENAVEVAVKEAVEESVGQEKKDLTKAIQEGAAKASQAAVKKLIEKPLSTGIRSGVEKDVVPGVRKEAKSVANAETSIVFNEWDSKINEHAAIPIYGIATLKQWMMENIKPEAMKKATEKATVVANAVMKLPDAQIKIMHITCEQKDQVLRQYKDQIKKCADQAANDYIEKAQE